VQGLAVEAGHPHVAFPVQFAVDRARSAAFHRRDHAFQAHSLAELDQPEPVVGHQHPTQQLRAEPFVRIDDAGRGDARDAVAGEDAAAPDAGGGDHMDAPGVRRRKRCGMGEVVRRVHARSIAAGD